MVLTPQQGRDIGDAFRNGIQGIVDNALSQAQAQVQARLDAMRAERAGLEAALNSTTSRPARREIQSRIDRLDQDIGEVERALRSIDRKVVTDVRPDVRTTTGTQPPFIPPTISRVDPTEIVATSLGILFVAFPLTLALVRWIWKRSTYMPAPVLSQEQTRRFDRLEQSVDAIAIEVERISENQRYLTKLLGEPKQASSVGSGQQL
jgi:hypothetical protein